MPRVDSITPHCDGPDLRGAELDFTGWYLESHACRVRVSPCLVCGCGIVHVVWCVRIKCWFWVSEKKKTPEIIGRVPGET